MNSLNGNSHAIRNCVMLFIRDAKRNYHGKEQEQNYVDVKRTWKTLRSVLHNNDNQPKKEIINDSEISGPTVIIELRRYFSRTGHRTIPVSSLCRWRNQTQNYSPGHDNIPVSMIKRMMKPL